MSRYGKVEVIQAKEEGSDAQIKVVFDYVGSKIDDLPVLGFWIYAKPSLIEGRGGFYTKTDKWKQPTYLGYCTNLSVTIKREKVEALAQKIANKVIEIAPNVDTPMMVGKMNYLHCDPTWKKWIKKLGIIGEEDEEI